MKKRIVSIIVLLTMIFSILLSCDEEVSSEMNTTDKSNVYKSTEITIPEDFRINTNANYKFSIIFNDDKAYFIGRSRETNDPTLIVYDLNTKTSVLEIIEPYNENASIDHIAFDTQKNRVTIEYDNGLTTLNKMSSDGDRIFSIEIGSDKMKMLIDKDDNIYIAFSDTLDSYDSDGKLLNSVSFGSNSFNDFGILDNGNVYVEFIDAYYRTTYRYVETNKKSLSATLTKNAEMKMYYGSGYDIYYSDKTSLYGYNESDNTMYSLINWMDSNIAHSGILNIYINSADKFIYDYRNVVTNDRIFYFAEKTDEVFTTEKKDVVIVCMDSIYMLDGIVLNYNNTNNEYNIILNQYVASFEDWETSITKLNNEIIAGEVPDIIIPNYSVPIMSYINKGIFTDIYQLIDNDPDISRDNFYDIALSTYEKDGKLYQLLAETSSVYTLMTQNKNVNGKDTWTYDEFKEFIDSIPDGSVFSDNFNRGTLYYIFADTGINDFVDYKNGTCDFENELFISIINTIKSIDKETYISKFPQEQFTEFQMNIGEIYLNNEIITSRLSIRSVMDFIRFLSYFNFEDITYMGFPTPYGDNNIATLYGTEFMITEQSQNKNGAWDFIKYYISDDVRFSKQHNSLPTTKSALKNTYEFYQSLYGYINENNGFMDINNYELSEAEITQNGFKPFEFKDEYFDMMEKLMNSKNRSNYYDDSLANIIYEELSIFFEGEKSAEETAKIIQNRASVYLSEIN